jgi:hypothetical protein
LEKLDLTELTQSLVTARLLLFHHYPQLLVNDHNQKRDQTRKRDKIRETVSARRKMKKLKNLLIVDKGHMSRKRNVNVNLRRICM